MNQIIEKINTIIENFDKAYGEWMDKKDYSLEDVMQIFKKHYYEFDDLYDYQGNPEENKLLDDILSWISDTVGEIYIDWGTDMQDYYNPGKELRSYVEKFVQS